MNRDWKLFSSPSTLHALDLHWVCDLIERVGNEGYMDGLALVDTMGVRTSIHAMQFFVRTMKTVSLTFP